MDVVCDLRIMYRTVRPLKDTGDFDGSEFYGFLGDFEANIDRRKLGIGEEIKVRGEVIRTFGEDTEEWKES